MMCSVNKYCLCKSCFYYFYLIHWCAVCGVLCVVHGVWLVSSVRCMVSLPVCGVLTRVVLCEFKLCPKGAQISLCRVSVHWRASIYLICSKPPFLKEVVYNRSIRSAFNDFPQSHILRGFLDLNYASVADEVNCNVSYLNML